MLDLQSDPAALRQTALALSKRQRHRGPDWSGIFAFVLHDVERDRYLIARDPIGVMPLYTGRDEHGTLFVASEMKALVGVCRTIEDFPPGHYLDSAVGEVRWYYEPAWRDCEASRGRACDIDALRHALDRAVERRLMCDVPLYLLARRIKSVGIKMGFTGEGSDEIFGGYLTLPHKAPNAREFHAENVRKLDLLYTYDCLRANKSMAAWGVEARVPFLDREFLDVAMGFDAADKMVTAERPVEKWILRTAFGELLPSGIVWRQKEQVSDRVGHSWIDSLKEACFYRSIFERHFPGDAPASCVPGGPSVACSTPAAVAWDEAFAKLADPSGRAVRGVHRESY